MSRDFKPGDLVIRIPPTNSTKPNARIIKEVQCPCAGEPPGTQSSGRGGIEVWPGLDADERWFEIELLPPGRGCETVPLSQLRHPT